MDIPQQFTHNLGIMSKEDFLKIKRLNILVVGLGGLGGHLAHNLIRMGVYNITLVDYDVFDETNLNRQMFSNMSNLGEPKVLVTKNALLAINPSCKITTFFSKIQDLNALSKYDYIVDCVDNVETKLYLVKLAKKMNIPLMHGACAGWYGQVAILLPGSELLDSLYSNQDGGLEKELKNPAFTPAFVASFMTSQLIQYILDSTSVPTNQLILLDMFNNIIVETGGELE